MKNEREIYGKLAAGAAMALALGMAASAQTTGGGGRPARHGTGLPEVSLEGDVREGRGPRQAPEPSWGGEIVVPEQSLRLGVRFVLGEELDPMAIFPMVTDLDKELVVEGGTSGGMVAIQLGLVTPTLDPLGAELAGSHMILGSFDDAGEIVVFLPKELDVRGLGARVAQIDGRFVSRVVNIEEAVNEAFASFDVLGSLANPSAVGGSGSKHELRRPSRGAGHGMPAQAPDRTVTLSVDLSNDIVENDFASFDKLGGIAKPQATGASGSKHDLRRPARGAGHGMQAQAPDRTVTRSVDLSGNIVGNDFATFDKLGGIAKPQATGASGSKQDLNRPVRGAGHASQAQAPDRTVTRSVDLASDIAEDESTSFEKLGDIANPAQAGGSGSMTELHRPSRGGHGRPR